LYFRKHLPRWQFLTLVTIVRLEAAIRGRWASLHAGAEEARAWAVIVAVARELRGDRPVRGRDVLVLAESIAPARQAAANSADPGPSRSPADPPESFRRPAWRQRRARARHNAPLGPRKDGPA